jgi:hypothetical protein
MAKGKLIKRNDSKIGDSGVSEPNPRFYPPVRSDGKKLVKRYTGPIGSLGVDSAGGRFSPPVK